MTKGASSEGAAAAGAVSGGRGADGGTGAAGPLAAGAAGATEGRAAPRATMPEESGLVLGCAVTAASVLASQRLLESPGPRGTIGLGDSC